MAVYRVVIRGDMMGQSVQLTRYWSNTAPTPNFQDFADGFGAVFQSAIQPITPNTLQWTDLYISTAVAGGLGQAFVPSAFPFVGVDVGGNYLPPHICVLCVYNGTLLVHPRQNRNRIPGILEAQVTSGELTPTALGLWQDVADIMVANLTLAQTWNAVLWSDEYQTTNGVASASVRNAISTQNSRKAGVGA